MDATKLYAITFVYIILEYICFSQCNAFYQNCGNEANNVSLDQLMNSNHQFANICCVFNLAIDDIKH